MEFLADLSIKRALLAPPGPLDDKYSRGVVGFLTGSDKYPGAALLGINAALASGIGMVCFEGSEGLQRLVISQRPEVVLNVKQADSLVIGSGLDLNSQDQLEMLGSFFSATTPKVIDAGALEVVDFNNLGALSILTPHLGEAIRLATRLGIEVSESESDTKSLALALAKSTGQIVLLKGSQSQIVSPSGLVTTFGPADPNLATAGTGDVLAGVIGALLARLVKLNLGITENNLMQICLIANQIHSLAAEISSARHEHGASAIVGAISEALEFVYREAH